MIRAEYARAVGRFTLTDLSEAASLDDDAYFFAVRVPNGRIGRAGVFAEAYEEEPDPGYWRERVLAWLNDNGSHVIDDLVDPGLIVLGRMDGKLVDHGVFPRSLNEVEKAIVRRVLELDEVPEREILYEQLEVAVASAPCDCACPSVSIEVDPARPTPISSPGRVQADAVYERGSIMVWADGGWLSNLELDWHTGDVPLEFPPVESLRRFEGYRART